MFVLIFYCRLQKTEDVPIKNIKRESKAYSFKEQQEEIQIRKEIEEKKRKAGVIKAPEMSEKQKETMRHELEKEAVIRNKVKAVSTEYFTLKN